MGTVIQISDNELERMIAHAYKEIITDRSVLDKPDQHSKLEFIIIKHLDVFFEIQKKHHNFFTVDQIVEIQRRCSEQLTKLYKKNESDNLQRITQSTQVNIKNIFNQKIFALANKYLLLRTIQKNSLSRYKKLKLEALYKRWKKRQKILATEKELMAQNEEDLLKKAQELDEKYSKEHEAFLNHLFGGGHQFTNDELRAQNFTAKELVAKARNCDNIGENISDLLSDMHELISLSEAGSENENTTNESKMERKKIIEKIKTETAELKQHLYDLDTLAKTPKEFKEHFEKNVLGKFESWHKNAKKLVKKDNHAAHKMVDNTFSKVGDELSHWIHDKHVERHTESMKAANLAEWKKILQESPSEKTTASAGRSTQDTSSLLRERLAKAYEEATLRASKMASEQPDQMNVSSEAQQSKLFLFRAPKPLAEADKPSPYDKPRPKPPSAS